MKKIKIYKNYDELDQLIKSLKIVIQKLSNNSNENVLKRKNVVEEYLIFISEIADSRQEKLVSGVGYFSGFSKGLVVSFLTHENMSFPTQVAGQFSLSEDISFGDKVSAKIKHVENSKSYLENLELLEKVNLSEPRILEIICQHDGKFVIKDFKTNWFLLHPTKENLQEYLKIDLEKLINIANISKASIYIQGILENVGKKVPMPKLDSFKVLYNIEENNQFNYLIKLKHLYSSVDDVKDDIKLVKEKIRNLSLGEHLIAKKVSSSYSVSDGFLIYTNYGATKFNRDDEVHLNVVKLDVEGSFIKAEVIDK